MALDFVMNASRSADFEKAKEVVIEFVEFMVHGGERKLWFGIIQYSDEVTTECNLNQHSSIDSIMAAISNIR